MSVAVVLIEGQNCLRPRCRQTPQGNVCTTVLVESGRCGRRKRTIAEPDIRLTKRQTIIRQAATRRAGPNMSTYEQALSRTRNVQPRRTSTHQINPAYLQALIRNS